MTLHAKFSVPIRDWSSWSVADFFICQASSSIDRRFNLSGGRRASIFCESRIMPRNSIIRLGPSVLCSAMGTPNVLNINNKLERLVWHA